MQRVVVTVSDDGALPRQRREWVVSITCKHAEGGETRIGKGPIIMPAVKLILEEGDGRRRNVTVPRELAAVLRGNPRPERGAGRPW
jgi:hypothetical protein